MLPHKARVVEEANDLYGKIDRLSSFIETNPIFHVLDLAEQDRLRRQLVHMQEYLSILNERINAFRN